VVSFAGACTVTFAASSSRSSSPGESPTSSDRDREVQELSNQWWKSSHDSDVSIGAPRLAGLSLYAASRAPAVWGQRIAWAGCGAVRSHILPGRARTLDADRRGRCRSSRAGGARSRSLRRGSRDTGGTLSSRVGFAALLLWRGAPLAIRQAAPGRRGRASNVEELALRMIEASWPRSFSAPRLLAAGVVGAVAILLHVGVCRRAFIARHRRRPVGDHGGDSGRPRRAARPTARRATGRGCT
jgi:hypothetical protein